LLMFLVPYVSQTAPLPFAKPMKETTWVVWGHDSKPCYHIILKSDGTGISHEKGFPTPIKWKVGAGGTLIINDVQIVKDPEGKVTITVNSWWTLTPQKKDWVSSTGITLTKVR
jgi:hypothetical protein